MPSFFIIQDPCQTRFAHRRKFSFGLRLAILTLLISAGAALGRAQYNITTVAGGTPPSTPVPALSASIGTPQGIASDAAGNIYFTSHNSVFKLDRSGNLTVIAGNSRPGYSGDGGPAVQAQLNSPAGLAIDGSGNLYIADTFNHRVRKVAPDGTISTIAGQGQPGYYGDSGSALYALLNFPRGVAVDSSGNVYIADTINNRIRKVDTNGIITTVVGTGTFGSAGDGSAASGAEIIQPNGLVIDTSGNLLIADTSNNRIRRVDTNGNISTYAGNGTLGFSGDGGPASKAELYPYALAIDGSNNLYVADLQNYRIRKIAVGGTISTIAGNGTPGFSGDGAQAANAQLYPYGLAVDGSGNLYVADALNNRIRKISSGGTITTVAGNGSLEYSGDGGPDSSAQLHAPTGVAVDAFGNFYIADNANHVVRKVASNGIISTVAGNGSAGYSGDGGPAISAQLSQPFGLALGKSGTLYVSDTINQVVRSVSVDGTIATFAGNGIAGYSGDGGPAANAQLNQPGGLAVDAAGNLYIADANNNRIREVTPGGVIFTAAGNGQAGYSGDGGQATAAELSHPTGVAVDKNGNLYIADSFNNVIRKVTSDGRISTFAGTGAYGNFGDGGKATAAQLSEPDQISVDNSGNVYFTDAGNNTIRQIRPDGTITTVAGNGSPGYSGDNGPATSAQLDEPAGLAVDNFQDIYVADTNNNVIRLLQPGSVTISGIANAASNTSGKVAPGEMVLIYGTGMGLPQFSQSALDSSSGLILTSLAGTQVSFNGIPAPIIYASGTQIAAIVPYEVSGTSAQVQVSYNGQTSSPFSVGVADSAPGIFTVGSAGKGPAAAVNGDGSVNDALHPAAPNSDITLFVTGEGQTSPKGVDGLPATAPFPQPVQGVSVTIGGVNAAIDFIGEAPGEAGVLQINARIPASAPGGSAVPVTVTVGSVSSQSGVTIAVAAH